MDIGKLIRKTQRKTLNSRLKTIGHMSKRSEFSCTRKETVDIDIVIASRNSEKKLCKLLK